MLHKHQTPLPHSERDLNSRESSTRLDRDAKGLFSFHRDCHAPSGVGDVMELALHTQFMQSPGQRKGLPVTMAKTDRGSRSIPAHLCPE